MTDEQKRKYVSLYNSMQDLHGENYITDKELIRDEKNMLYEIIARFSLELDKTEKGGE